MTRLKSKIVATINSDLVDHIIKDYLTVCICSPYKSKTPKFRKTYDEYLKRCILDSVLHLKRYPFASHGFFTNYLDDSIKLQREMGIDAGINIGKRLHLFSFYIDHGMSDGMIFELKSALAYKKLIEFRRFGDI